MAFGSCSCWKDQSSSTPGEAAFEGIVQRGGSYQHIFGPGLTFVLEGNGPWVIQIVHASQKDKDLVYPVNPPYRTQEHLMIGEGYGKTAQESIQSFPRTFSFLYREEDISEAWAALEKILWPKSNQDLEEGSNRLEVLPRGKGRMEVQSVKYYALSPGSPNSGAIEELKFIVHLSWGKK